MKEKKHIIKDYLHDTKKYANRLISHTDEIIEICDILKKSWMILVCANGGSAATASHFTNDLQKIGNLRAFCLTDNTPLLTAWANDDSWDNVFIRQIENISTEIGRFIDEPNETIVILTGSGNSENLIRLAEWGIDNGKYVIAFIGMDDGRLGKMNSIKKIHIKSDMFHSEDWQSTLCHLIAKLLGDEE